MIFTYLPYPQVEELNQKMCFVLSSVKNATHLRDYFQLEEQVEKICDIGEVLAAEKVQEGTSVFQKNGLEALVEERAHFFQQLEEIEKNGLENDLSIVKRVQAIASKAEDLELQFIILSPEQIAEEIRELSNALRLLAGQKFYNEELLEDIVAQALKKVRHLQFRLDFPIVEELCEFSYQNNFARSLQQIVQDLRRGDEKSFAILLPHQKKFIVRSMGAEKKSLCCRAEKALQYLRTLQMLSHLAQDFLYEDAKKVIARFDILDLAIRKAIDGYLFRASGTLFKDLKNSLKKGHLPTATLCAQAVMAFVEEQVMGS